MKKQTYILSILLLFSLLLSSCSGLDFLSGQVAQEPQQASVPSATTEPAPVQPVVIDNGLLAAYENALSEIYDGVNPSVVSIRVVQQAGASGGSGFVWDQEGHIVTNNHVVAGAERIEVEFYDGTIVSGELIGSDADSDLAVIAVDVSESFLVPVQLADSDTVRVGQLAIAIGNPFALENTMTVGIISALGRTIPAGQVNPFGPSYSIPDVIQTDAPINPGNSGGVLVNDLGEVIGVTAAIESPSRANAGIGFAIPSNIVARVVPVLIEEGRFQHPYLGITGTRLTPDLSTAMDLEPEQRGALVISVTREGPADQAGLQGSDQRTTINEQETPIGGDVLLSIDGNPIRDMDDLIAYLFSQTTVGQEVTLKILRDGEEMEIQVTLAARPAAQTTTQSVQLITGAYLGIGGRSVTPEIARAMELPEDLSGVLVEEVHADSPAQEAGLLGGTEEIEVQDQRVLIGGDIITSFDGQPITFFQELAALISQSEPGEEVELTIIRDGDTLQIPVTLAERPQ